jgi:CrcB protein
VTPSAVLLVLIGGGIGAVGRFAMTGWVSGWSFTPAEFPWATVFINIAGSFGIGLLWGLGHEQPWFDHWGRYLLVTGLLGGFTTFSAFSLETVALIESGQPWHAAGNAAASVLGCVLAAWFGLRLTAY